MNDLPCTEAVLCRYRYDALDRLAAVDSGSSGAVQRFYQKSRLSVEIQGALRRRVFQFEDQLLAEHRINGATSRTDLLGTDSQRSVLHTQGGAAPESIAYSPYGHCPPASVLLGFNGERRDPLTGHYLLGNGYRAYNPVLMRFNQPDNLSPFGRGGLNAYAYCQGDPVNRRDPSGHAPVLTFSNFLSNPIEPILSAFIKNTPGTELSVLARTSKGVRADIERLSIVPLIDPSNPKALGEIEMALRGDTRGALPGRLKKEVAFKTGFEKAAAASQARMTAQIDEVEAKAQSIITSVAGEGATLSAFMRRLTHDRKIHADAPRYLADIDGVHHHYQSLLAKKIKLKEERSGLTAFIKTIRRNFEG